MLFSQTVCLLWAVVPCTLFQRIQANHQGWLKVDPKREKWYQSRWPNNYIVFIFVAVSGVLIWFLILSHQFFIHYCWSMNFVWRKFYSCVVQTLFGWIGKWDYARKHITTIRGFNSTNVSFLKILTWIGNARTEKKIKAWQKSVVVKKFLLEIWAQRAK